MIIAAALASLGAFFVGSKLRAQNTPPPSCASLSVILKEYGRELNEAGSRQADLASLMSNDADNVQLACQLRPNDVETFFRVRSREVQEYADTSRRIGEFLANADCK